MTKKFSYVVVTGTETIVQSATKGMWPAMHGISVDPSLEDFYGVVLEVPWGSAQRLASDLANDFMVETSPQRDLASASDTMMKMLRFSGF